ncbi:MAG: glycosyltransferase family 4 protein [Planctomycetales bacterium]|nr:glycosyltransferase family 4 protein [Planctomycetales bacterium]
MKSSFTMEPEADREAESPSAADAPSRFRNEPIWVRGDDGRPRLARLLLSAYACSPARGSEHAVGWNRALQAARRCETTVLCDDHSRDEVETFAARYGWPERLRIVWLSRLAWEPKLFRLPAGYYWYLRRWQRRALSVARQLHVERPFDLVHHANYCGFREPGHLWRLDVPFVWGPVGGTQSFPQSFARFVDRRGAIREAIRGVVNSAQLRYSPRVRQASRRAATVLAANSTGQRDLWNAHRLRADWQLETGLSQLAECPPTPRRSDEPLRILWSGNLETWKAPQILFAALARVQRRVPNSFRLTMLGQGRLREDLERLAERGGFAQHVQWLGQIPYAEALGKYRESHVLAFTSLRDTSGNVVLEAMAAGVPIVCFDLHGARDMVTDDCGVKISIERPASALEDWAAAIEKLFNDEPLRLRLAAGACERAAYFLWDRQGERMAAVYRHVLRDQLVESPPADYEHATVTQEHGT